MDICGQSVREEIVEECPTTVGVDDFDGKRWSHARWRLAVGPRNRRPPDPGRDRHESTRIPRFGKSAWEDVADPGIQDATDAIVRVDTVTICGTDLHILKGDIPEVRPGTVLGHEAVGEIVDVGNDVRTVRPGDRVLVSCITACGRCRFCREGTYGQCRAGGAGSSAT